MTDGGPLDKQPLRIGVLLSGGGRTLQNLLDKIRANALLARVAAVISDRPDAYGLERARANSIPAFCEREPRRQHELLAEHRVQLVCLCGYLRLFPIPREHAGAVLNIHPALLPKHGGK